METPGRRPGFPPRRAGRAGIVRRPEGALLACMALNALLLAALPGCAGDSDAERGMQRLFGDIGHGVMGHRSSREDLTLPVENLVNVDVRNFCGDVIIRGDKSGRTKDARVILDRRGVHEGSRGGESSESLPDITWDAKIVPAAQAGDPPTLTITTTTAHEEPWFQRVDIEILVGELGRVDVVTTRGRVQVSNNHGALDITTTKGDVRVITAWPQTTSSVILTSDGDIDFRVRGESAFVLDAETVGGTIKTRCENGRWSAVDARNDHDSMLATLNGGVETITLRTVDGDIRVAVVGDPHAVGSHTIQP